MAKSAPKTKPTAQPVAKAKAVVRPTPKAKVVAKPAPKAKPVVRPAPKAVVKPVAKAKAVVKTKAAPKARPTAQPVAKAKAAKAAPKAKQPAAPSAAFTSIVAILGDNPGVGTARMFGAHGLGLGGRYFAMEFKGALVVKLPAARVDALVADGTGHHFDPGMGRPMKEWLSVTPGRGDWQRLAEEALAYTATLPPK